jgi:hypothetical protein
LARLLKNGTPSIAALLRTNSSNLEYLHDRTKIMGFVRKKYAKEATVFRLKLPKDGFLRVDHSIDLYKARQVIVRELSHAMGEIRDYNGGMISKQTELFAVIRSQLSGIVDLDELLLENFFYSLSPMVVRALLDPKAFCTLFLMLLEGIRKYNPRNQYYVKFHTESYNVFAMLILEDGMMKEEIHQRIQDLEIPSTELAYSLVKSHGYNCMGYICCAHDPKMKELLFEVIQTQVVFCESIPLMR